MFDAGFNTQRRTLPFDVARWVLDVRRLPFRFSLRFQHFDKRLLWNIDFSDAFHPFLSFFLFLQQFPLSSDIAAVAFCGYVFSQGRNVLSRDNFAADGGLYCHLIKLAWNDLL